MQKRIGVAVYAALLALACGGVFQGGGAYPGFKKRRKKREAGNRKQRLSYAQRRWRQQ